MSKKLNLIKHSEFLEAEKQTETVPFLSFTQENIVLPDTTDITINMNQLNEDGKLSVKKAIEEHNGWLVLTFYSTKTEMMGKMIEPVGVLSKVSMQNDNTRLLMKPKFKYNIVSQNRNLISGKIFDDLPTLEEKDELMDLSRKCTDLLIKIIALDEQDSGEGIQYLQESLNTNSDPSILFAVCLSFTEFRTEQLMTLFLTKKLQQKFKILIEIFQIELDQISNQFKEKERINFYKQLKNKVDAEQQQAMLKEMRSEIDKKLEPDLENIADTYEKKLESISILEESKTVLKKEIRRLKNTHPASAEYNVIENYLSTIFSIPWNHSSNSNFEIQAIRDILNADHTGIDQVKKRITQFLAVSKVSEKPTGQILCLFGPPGVGKTSICKSIAKALNREYVRVSLGGVSDESEMRGHRKTYVGAMPGKIINALISCKTNNPVIVLDEIDKISKQSMKGNVEAALLEILDPEQNKSFVDHYVNLKVDLSNVFFIATANDISQISAPLRDRMDMIEMDSYTVQEKINIAVKHLIPQELEKSGLTRKNIKTIINESAIQKLITQYTREAGVRKLRQKIATIVRSCAEKYLDGATEFSITSKNLTEFIDDDFMEIEKIKDSFQPGIVTGLAWTPVGGDVLFVEASAMSGSGNIKLTGQLGDVMKESAQLALSYIREHDKKLGLENIDHKSQDIHIHFPAGATPKDGPSAGVALVTTLVSLLKNQAVSPKIAMTGEISLKGDVLPVGGIKEKLIAAHTHKIEHVMIPKENEKDLKKLPQEILNDKNFKIHLIETIEDAMDIVFKEAISDQKNTRSKKVKNVPTTVSI